jgi:hypothetical protein
MSLRGASAKPAPAKAGEAISIHRMGGCLVLPISRREGAAASNSLEPLIVNLRADPRSAPQKALELPLLKRDVQGLQQQFERDLSAMKAESARFYELMKWLVGLMAVVSLGMVAAAAGNLLKREGTEKTQRWSQKGSGTESHSVPRENRTPADGEPGLTG